LSYFPKMKPRKKLEPEEDFQMAPMIDMVFLLLVFFMVVSNVAQADKSVPLNLPESARAKVPEDLTGRGRISLAHNPESGQTQIYIASDALTLEQMRSTIEAALKRDPELRIMVRADKTVPYREIKEVLKACAEVGAYEIIYATYEE
jgi:biopolymer transport protein ExbD